MDHFRTGSGTNVAFQLLNQCQSFETDPELQFNGTMSTLLLGVLLLTPVSTVRSHLCGFIPNEWRVRRVTGVKTKDLLESPRINQKKELTSLICVGATGAEPGRPEVPTEQTPRFTASATEHAWVEINC